MISVSAIELLWEKAGGHHYIPGKAVSRLFEEAAEKETEDTE
jgi:hypothetical protein